MRKNLFFICFIIFSIFASSITNAQASLEIVDENISGIFNPGGTIATLSSQSAYADLNDDGAGDLILGHYNYSNSGRVIIIWGGPTTLDSFTQPSNISYVIPTDLTGPPINFGWTIETADLNQDSVEDLIVGAQVYGNNNEGRAYIFWGGTDFMADGSSPDLTFTGVNERLSYPIETGDVNNDSKLDLILGGTDNGGKVKIYYAPLENEQAPDLIPTTNLTPNYFLSGQILSAGNFNNDLYTDLIISTYNDTDSNFHLLTYFGNENGLSLNSSLDTIIGPGTTYGWNPSFEHFDVNGDGCDDFFYSFYEYSLSKGIVRASYCTNEFSTNIDREYIGEASGHRFGRQIVNVGDLENDGYNELAIGAYGYPTNDNNGKVYVYKGGEILPETHTWEKIGDAIGDRFAVPIKTGDFNENGFVDFMVYAYGFPGGAYNGKLYLLELAQGVQTVTADLSTTQIDGTATNTDPYIISGVEWSTSPDTTGDWIPCVASDGAFDSGNENFSCDISSLGYGEYTIYLRSFDQNGVYIGISSFAVVNYSNPMPLPDLSQTGIDVSVILWPSLIGFVLVLVRRLSQVAHHLA